MRSSTASASTTAARRDWHGQDDDDRRGGRGSQRPRSDRPQQALARSSATSSVTYFPRTRSSTSSPTTTITSPRPTSRAATSTSRRTLRSTRRSIASARRPRPRSSPPRLRDVGARLREWDRRWDERVRSPRIRDPAIDVRHAGVVRGERERAAAAIAVQQVAQVVAAVGDVRRGCARSRSANWLPPERWAR